MSLVFHSSNRLEILAATFAELSATHHDSPFSRDMVVVQTMGMGRFLALRLADYQGISANLEILFPNAILDRLFALVLPEFEDKACPLQATTLWQIMKILPGLCHSSETADTFTPVSNFLADDENGLKLYRLAGKIADIFDQYQIYRPEMVLAWDENNDWFNQHPGYDRDHAWQQVLWQHLYGGRDALPHRAAAGRDFIVRMAGLPPGDAARLPKHISFFGVSVIPRFHLDIFQAAARCINLDFFLLSPCREYWGYIKTRKEIKRAERQSGKKAEEMLLEEVNPLLASQGILGRDFLNMILELDSCELKENFINPVPQTCLQTIQNDLLDLVDPHRALTRPISDPEDGTIQFHSCHGPLREVEVLYDRLLAILAADSSLNPADILVMTPDLAAYAPLIRAVFANPYDEQTRIPFSIADTGPSRDQIIMAGLDCLLKVLRGRFPAPEILGLLDNPAIAARFSFSTQDIAVIRTWLQGAGIRWGIDREMMAEENLPRLAEISWQAGRERLILGYAMSGDFLNGIADIYPFADFDEDDSLLLGNFLDFFDLLAAFRREIKKSHTLEGWQKILSRLQKNFLSGEGPFSEAYTNLEKLIAGLKPEEKKQGEISLGLEIIRAALRDANQGRLHSQGFMGSGLTFCAMLPMRSIPFKVIAMIGMNDGSFPRLKKNLEFDLTMAETRPGDRNPRENDKYLFLETFISARKIFYLSFCGQSPRDNNQAPPSVLVSELLDYLAARYNLGRPEQEKLITRHRLQPFNEKYFQGNARFPSFSMENCRAAQAKANNGGQAVPLFLSRPLAQPQEKITTIALENLLTFFRQPVKFLYNKVLGIYLDRREETIKGAEIFVPDALESYQLKEELLPRPEAGPETVRARAAMLAARGRMPLGNPGGFYLEELQEEVVAWQRWLGRYLAAPLLPRAVDIQLNSGIKISGTLTGLYNKGQLLCRPTKLGASEGKNGFKINKKKDLMRGWILHLVANCLADCPQTTIIAGIDRSAALFPPLDNAGEFLAGLAEIYRAGQHQLVPFFPEYSLALVAGEDAGKLAGRWRKDEYDGASDIYNAHCFGEAMPLDDEFVRLAHEIGGPIYEQAAIWREEE